VMQFVIWGIYVASYFRLFSGRVSGGDI
jgi:hypothetical protein